MESKLTIGQEVLIRGKVLEVVEPNNRGIGVEIIVCKNKRFTFPVWCDESELTPLSKAGETSGEWAHDEARRLANTFGLGDKGRWAIEQSLNDAAGRAASGGQRLDVVALHSEMVRTLGANTGLSFNQAMAGLNALWPFIEKLAAPAAPELSEGEAYTIAGEYELEIAKVIGDYEAGKYRIPIVKIIQRALLRKAGGQ